MKWIQIFASLCLFLLLTLTTKAQQSGTVSLGKVKMVFTLDQNGSPGLRSIL